MVEIAYEGTFFLDRHNKDLTIKNNNRLFPSDRFFSSF